MSRAKQFISKQTEAKPSSKVMKAAKQVDINNKELQKLMKSIDDENVRQVESVDEIMFDMERQFEIIRSELKL